MARGTFSDRGGFTLLEVLIAFAILAVGVVSLIQLTSQGLRLLKVSGDHQQAVQIADRIARDTQVNEEEVTSEATVETGEEGSFAWERRVTRVALPEELEPKTPVPGKEVPGLYAVAVAVRWGHNHMVEVATLRAPTGPATVPATNPADQQGQTGQGGAIPGGAAGSGGPATPGRNQTGPFGTGSSSSSGTSSSSSSSSNSSSRGGGTTRTPAR
jgi:general secretion pathway protein I